MRRRDPLLIKNKVSKDILGPKTPSASTEDYH